MKYSIYNYKFKYNDYIGVFNTFTGSIVLFQDINENIFENNVTDLNKLTIEKYKTLGIVIEDHIDEKDILLSLRKKKIEELMIPYFRIFTTYSCNANCFYCFEKKDNANFITEKTADKIVAFIIKKAGKQKKATISWFGGEPLVNHKMITYICNKLNVNNIEFESSIVSNGTLFSQQIINDAINVWKLKKVQITLDGLKDIHNSRKNYPVTFNGFQKTIDSIHLLSKNNIKVSIRLNYDNKNLESIYELIDFLKTEFKDDDNVSCYSHFLFENYFYNSSDNSFLQTYEINKKLVDLNLLSYKFLFNILKRKNGLCGFCRKDHYAIEPDGSLLKCPDDTTSRYGNIEKEWKDKDLFKKWTNPELDEKCNKCIFLPLCQGGCRCAHFHDYADKCDLDKELLDTVLKDYIDNHIDNQNN